jgi:two-component system chemotaxis response regulator CheV
MSSENILLKSGTNELELLEFSIKSNDGQVVKLGLNVAKVREIIKTVDLRPLPDTHASVQGIFELRGHNIQSLDIKHFLFGAKAEKSIYIIMEFSKMRIAMAVDDVSRIRRVEWNKIKSFETVAENLQDELQNNITGVFYDGESHIYILDVEKIVAEVKGRDILNAIDEDTTAQASGLIMTAEDSGFLRKRITSQLKKTGFEVSDHADGQKAYNWIKSQAENECQLPDAVITDVEMPEMDGYTLTKRIKEDPKLKHIPVVIFSSLITDDVIHKGVSVGADRQLSKPDLNILIDIIRDLV